MVKSLEEMIKTGKLFKEIMYEIIEVNKNMKIKFLMKNTEIA